MERSSPLAALQPACMNLHWARPDPFDYDSNFLCPQPKHFNFRDMSMFRKPRNNDYFSWNPVRGSSPTASLAVDLSQNFHIDKTPQQSTPRRSLFQNVALPDFNGDLATPPIPSSSPAPESDPMDCSPLPHKPAFFAKVEYVHAESSLPTPDPTPLVDEGCFLPQQEPEASQFRRATPPRLRKLTAPRPAFKKNLSANNVPSRPSSSNPAFVFGSSSSNSLGLLESFVESPPSERKISSSHSASYLAPAPPKLSLLQDGSPVAPLARCSRPAARKGLGRRTQSLQCNNPPRPMRQEKRCCTDGAIASVADVQQPYDLKLPNFKPHDDPESLPRISPDTLVDVLKGHYSHVMGSATVVDCRFEYEFQGGHIEGAVNFNDKDALARELFNTAESLASRALIFHCEYSAHRAPKMAAFIREQDRIINAERYPHLTFPEVYILDGGYSGFFNSHQALCYPQAYKRMDAAEHEDDCERGMARVKRRAKLSRAQTYAFGQAAVRNEAAHMASLPDIQSPTATVDCMEIDFEQAITLEAPLQPRRLDSF